MSYLRYLCLFGSFYLQFIVGGLMSYLLYLSLFGSSLSPVYCRRAHVLFRMFGSFLPPVYCRRALT
jgi:hypothetical protein